MVVLYLFTIGAVFITIYVHSFISAFRRRCQVPFSRQPSHKELVKMAFEYLLDDIKKLIKKDGAKERE